MSWSNEETFKFIDLYKREPIIWNPKHEHYKDRAKVQEAWNRLEYGMQIPVTELKKKKETLMTAFRLHYKKILQSIRANEDEIYKPIWIFYEALETFLKDVYEPPSVLVSDNFESTSFRQETDGNDELDEQDDDNLNDSSSEKKVDIKPKVRLAKRLSNVPLELQEVSKEVSDAFNMLNQALKTYKRPSEPSPREEDDCDLYGRLLAKRLRQFSETDRQEIMYELDGLILSRFQGNTGIANNSDLSDS